MNKQVYQEVMDRADGACEMCGASDLPLQLHHIYGGHGKRQQTENTNNCVALCVFCHINVHMNREYDLQLKRMAQDRLREKGLTDDEIRKMVGGKLYG